MAARAMEVLVAAILCDLDEDHDLATLVEVPPDPVASANGEFPVHSIRELVPADYAHQSPFRLKHRVKAALDWQDSLRHCLRSTWAEHPASRETWNVCTQHVLDFCCNIVKDRTTSQRVIERAFAVLMEVQSLETDSHRWS